MSEAIKVVGIWVIFLVATVINGIIREEILIPTFSFNLALPISGLLLSAMVLFIAYILIPFIRVNQARYYLKIGFLWAALTLVFEFIFRCYILGKSWQEISEKFNIKSGE